MRRLPLAAVFLLAAGCAPSLPVALPPPPSLSARPDDLSAGAASPFASKRFGLIVPLPEGTGWRVDDRSGTWLTAVHAASSSALLVRLWREEAPMSRLRCLERARADRKLPEWDEADVLERRRVDVPPEYDTVVEVGVRPLGPASRGTRAGPGELFQGFLAGFGGNGRRCFAFVFVTKASGPGAAEVLGDRLAVMSEKSLGGLSFVSGLSPRLERAPSPVGPGGPGEVPASASQGSPP